MSAIRLPVKVVLYGLYWCVTDANYTTVTTCIGREPADKIALALNLHNQLMAFARRCADETQGLHFRYRQHGGAFYDSIDIVAKTLLARAETTNEPKP